GSALMVEPNATSADYLDGFLQGTRRALYENGRESITLTVHEVSAFVIGVLIALFERAVGLYASLINVNAYHQPGVEAGKKAANDVIEVQRKILEHLKEHSGKAFTVDALAKAAGLESEIETVFKVLQHITANPDHAVKRELPPGRSVFDATYRTGR